jgi:hypothetical protein
MLCRPRDDDFRVMTRQISQRSMTDLGKSGTLDVHSELANHPYAKASRIQLSSCIDIYTSH